MAGHPLTERLWALSAAFHGRLARELAALDLTVAELRLVGEVMRAEGGLRQGELAALLSVRPPTVSAALARLEAAGVVIRERDPADPRARLVKVAPDAPLERGLAALDRMERAAATTLSATDRRRLPRVLDRMIAALEDDA